MVCVNNDSWLDYTLEVGDILFARTGATTGKSYCYRENDGKLVFAGFLIKFHPDPTILSAKYLSYFVNTNHYWNWVRTMSTRSGQPGINEKEYRKMKIIKPTIYEQKKIASTLSTLDIEIEKLQDKKQFLEEQKKGLMQQLLTGKTRVKIEET